MNSGLLLVLLFTAATIPWLVRKCYPPLPRLPSVTPQAVVVLGGGIRRQNGQFAPSQRSLHRLLLANSAAQHLSLPLLISGGGRVARAGGTSEARVMRDVVGGSSLVIWLEEASDSTYANARLSAALLREHGIRDILLVTDRSHMTRAMLCFHRQDIAVRPLTVDQMPAGWMPSAGTLLVGLEVWYEWAALLLYLLRGRLSLF